jgi:hypothetical protein
MDSNLHFAKIMLFFVFRFVFLARLSGQLTNKSNRVLRYVITMPKVSQDIANDGITFARY